MRTSIELDLAVHHLAQQHYYFNANLLCPDDIMLASFPRSGSHFVRFIILSARHLASYGNLPLDFSSMTDIPDIHNCDVHRAKGTPRIIKTHFPYDPRYKRIIHLVRDPRDVAVSYYHYVRKTPTLLFKPLAKTLKLPQFIGLFINGEIWPLRWDIHTLSFIDAASETDYIRIQYEALLNDPTQEITRLLAFINVDLARKDIEQLANHVGFDRMKSLHNPESAAHGRVFTDSNLMFRKGKVGRYHQILKLPMIRRIEDRFEKAMSICGYSKV